MRNTAGYCYLVMVSLVVAIAYFPSFNGSFIFDDLNNVRDNPSIIVFPPELSWQNPASRWVTTLTFAMNYQLSGWDASGYRISNLAMHLGCGWLIAILTFQIASQVLAKEFNGRPSARYASFILAALWLLHPLSSSAVAYIVQRSEILAACAIVVFLIAIVRDSQSESPIRFWQWIAAAVFVVGICSKTNAVSALPIAVLMDRLLLCDSWSAVIKRRGVLYLVPVMMGVLSLWVLLPGLQRGDAGVGFSDDIPSVPIYLATQSQVFWHYLFLCIWPSELSIDYRWPPVSSVAAATPWIVATLSVLGFGIWRYCKGNLDGWLILSLFLLLAPTSTLIPITDIAVDHRMYLGLAPVIGLCLILLSKVKSWLPSWFPVSGRIQGGMLCLVLAMLFLRTYVRAQDWSSGFDLWYSAARVTPSNPRALQNLTSAAKDEGREAELISVMTELRQQALASGAPAPAVASRLGEEYVKAGNSQLAEPLLREAVAGLDPQGTIDERQEHAAARINLALVLLQRAEINEAETHLRAAVVSDPKVAYAHAMLGDLMMQQSKFAEAAKHFKSALDLQPDWEQVKSDLAKAIDAAKTE